MARVKLQLSELANLPAVCVCCGQPATLTRRQEFEVNTGTSAAIMATSALLGAMVWTKRGITLTLPVCTLHKRRGRRSNRTFFQGLAITIAFGLAAYIASELDHPSAKYLAVTATIVMMGTMVAGMSQVSDGLAIRAVETDTLTLGGANPKFAEAVAHRQAAFGLPSPF